MDKTADKGNKELILKQYDILMQQNRFEHTSFWTRFGFMMISQMALLGFFLNLLLNGLKETNPRYLLLTLPLCLVGLTLVYFFYRLQKITKWWVDRWLELILRLEQGAFADINVVRKASEQSPGSVRRVATWFTSLFAIIWSLAVITIIFLVTCDILKGH
jgi:hypothetical protein